MESTNKSNSINLGLYLGGMLSLIVVLIYAVNLDLFIEWWLGILLFVLVVAYGVVAVNKAKKNGGGFVSFKDAFIQYFITIAVGTFIGTIVSIAIFAVIDPDAATYLNEQILILSKTTMERFGAPQEVITTALEEASKKDNFSIGMQLQSYVFRLAFYAIVGLIVALIVKKTDTSEA